jgi:hypothetical protein
MEAACRGAREMNGITVVILPGTGKGNGYLEIVIRTGLGQAGNVVVVQSADAFIAVGGSHGTLFRDHLLPQGSCPGIHPENVEHPGCNGMQHTRGSRDYGSTRRTPVSLVP